MPVHSSETGQLQFNFSTGVAMQDLNDKITGGTLTATEWNQLPTEVQNVIAAAGITLASGDLNQLGKAIAGYVANGSFYTDVGAANAYVLSVLGAKQSPAAYIDGMSVSFIATNNSTAPSTVNVAGLGVKNIKLADGSDPFITGRVLLSYDLGNDRFEFVEFGGGGPSLGADSVIRTNAKTIDEDITFAGTENGMSAGPITISATFTVTVTSGSTWVIV